VETRIVGGAAAPAGRFPSICSLRSATSGAHFCGGTLIHAGPPAVVLTAGHCLDQVNAALRLPVVHCGRYNLTGGVAGRDYELLGR
jgi:secreted trypsin-like serine protease